MSWQAVEWVLDHSESEGKERCVMIAIAERADPAGGGSRQGRARIAQRARCSEETVKRAIAHMIELGEVAVRSFGSGRGRRNEYTLAKMVGILPLRTSERGSYPQATSGPGWLPENGTSENKMEHPAPENGTSARAYKEEPLEPVLEPTRAREPKEPKPPIPADAVAGWRRALRIVRPEERQEGAAS